jgi:hypothetical protein
MLLRDTLARSPTVSSPVTAAITNTVDPLEEILRGAKLIMQPGAVHELRILNADRQGTISGYFDDPLRLVQAAMELDVSGRYAGIFITLNACNPALLARCCNRVKPFAKVTTADADIVWRRWLLFDFDPKRPAGISSTDAEHGRAMTVAYGAADDLRGLFGDPAVGDSGNGAHLLYPTDLPNTAASTVRIQKVLKGVARRCASDDVGVDLTVYNAARIVKLYGTMARKGDSTKERPHRRSRIVEVPAVLRPITEEFL